MPNTHKPTIGEMVFDVIFCHALDVAVAIASTDEHGDTSYEVEMWGVKASGQTAHDALINLTDAILTAYKAVSE